MFELLQMWALIEVLGLVCLPLTITVLHNLPDRGWAFSKTLGLALFAFCVWFPLMCLQVLPFSRLFIVGIALIVLSCNLLAFVRLRHTLLKVIRSKIVYIVATELVFLGMVFLLGWLRSYGPGIRSYEMFMDEGFIAAIMRSPHMPPNDMWFAGYSLNYYYYAHFAVAMLAKLLGQSASIAFNTGICMFFGLTAVNLFGVTCNIVSWARYVRTRTHTQDTDMTVERPDTVYPSLARSIPYGLLTMLMGLILGNLAATQQWWQQHDTVFTNMTALQQWLQNHAGWAQYDWFTPSRVIGNTINEFPAFSFLLSCFHAHVLTLAFTILAMGMAFNLLLEADGKGLFAFGRGWRLLCTLLMTALVLGGLFAMNGWDFPTYLGLVLVCIALQQWRAYDSRLSLALCLDIIIAAVGLTALAFLLYLPFYLTFVSPAQGIGIVNATDRTQLHDELLIYGLFAFVYLSLLMVSALKNPVFPLSSLLSRKGDEDGDEDEQEGGSRIDWLRVGFIGCVLIFLLGLLALGLMRNSSTFVIAMSITILGVILLFRNIGDRAHAFVLLLGAVAFALVAVCEVVFLKDVFAGNFPRMNTVFKLYFEAWAMLSIACGAGLFFVLEGLHPVKVGRRVMRYLQRGGQAVWIVGLLLLVLAGAAYPLSAPEARYAISGAQGFTLQRTNNLDGLSYLATDPANPGDYAAIRWLNAHVQGDPAIIEAVGGDYSNYARISAFTGLPTPMGWIGHEIQWRINWFNKGTNDAEFQRRATDVDTIYKSLDSATVLSLMAHYKAVYLYVGPIEYAKYSTVNLRRFGAFMQVAYNAEGVTIYKVR